MLTADAAMTMPPIPTWYRGHEAISAFLEGSRARQRTSAGASLPIRSNGQVAFGKYQWKKERARFAAHSISVLTLDGELIADFTSFLDPELVSSFGLPDQL